MPSYIYDPIQDKIVLKDDYLLAKYFSQEPKQMMIGNKPVKIYYNSDEMTPTKHMVNGKLYTSKKKFRDETRARGCVEVGNETNIKPRQRVNPSRKQRREDIKKAIYDIRNATKR